MQQIPLTAHADLVSTYTFFTTHTFLNKVRLTERHTTTLKEVEDEHMGDGLMDWGGGRMGMMLDNVNTNTHHGGAGHSSSVPARAELSGRETLAPPPREGWC